jgi:hypothetical protein
LLQSGILGSALRAHFSRRPLQQSAALNLQDKVFSKVRGRFNVGDQTYEVRRSK